MRRVLALALALVACVASGGASFGHVVELTDANFDGEVGKGPTLVVVSADWCTHCKALAPTWQTLATTLAGETVVARVNGPKHKALLKRLGVTAYPTILYLRDGSMREYAGGKRTVDALVAFTRAAAETIYKNIRKQHNLSDVTILFIALSVPVAAGVLAVAAADVYVTRTAMHAGAMRRQREASSFGGGGPQHGHAHRD